MIFRYIAKGKTLRKKSMFMALGVVAIPLSFVHSHAASPPVRENVPAASRDPRVARLHGFLKKLKCPVASMSEDFVKAADENKLDWRLLPSIAVIESGGGKAFKNNNIFGWNKGDQSFATIRSGLELVAYNLGHSPLYRRHGVLGKLRVYNEHEDYPGAVMAVMNRINPQVRMRPVSQPSYVPIDIASVGVIRY